MRPLQQKANLSVIERNLVKKYIEALARIAGKKEGQEVLRTLLRNIKLCIHEDPNDRARFQIWVSVREEHKQGAAKEEVAEARSREEAQHRTTRSWA